MEAKLTQATEVKKLSRVLPTITGSNIATSVYPAYNVYLLPQCKLQ